MDSNFTFALPALYLRTLHICLKFVLILPLGSLHRSLRVGLTSDVAADRISMCADDLDLLSLRDRCCDVTPLNLAGRGARDGFHDVDCGRAFEV
jgi:hypothetical protein